MDDIEKKLEKEKAKLESLTAKRYALREELRPLQEAMVKNGEETRRVQEQISALLAERMGSNPDWAVLLAEENSDILHKPREIAISALGLFPTGRWTDTGQPVAKVMIRAGRLEQSLKQTREAVEILTPFYTPHADGYVWFGIFEHSLSEHGIYVLKVLPDLSEVKIEITRYHRTSVVRTAVSLDEALQFIGKNLYYDNDTDK